VNRVAINVLLDAERQRRRRRKAVTPLDIDDIALTPGAGTVSIDFTPHGPVTHVDIFRSDASPYKATDFLASVAVTTDTPATYDDLAAPAGTVYYWLTPRNGTFPGLRSGAYATIVS
jgi:hypothetical protein